VILRRLIAGVLVSLVLAVGVGHAAEVRIASWNIQNLGWGENKSFPALARVIAQYDFVAIQELMNEEAIEHLRDKLEDKTGQSWEALYSHPLGRTSYREKYAFLWRDDVIEYVDGAVVYLDDRDHFAREPFSARFRARDTDFDFVAATVHVTYGRRIADRTPEIHALRLYWDWLAEVYPETDTRRLLLGDFNLRPAHEAWGELLEVAQPLITEGATTLSTSDRQYANLYDNIFVPIDHDIPIADVGIMPFPELLTETTGRYWSHEKARRHVSDHAPVHVLVGARDLRSTTTGALHVPNRQASEDQKPDEPGCIDLNTAEPERLEELPHIGPSRAEMIVEGRPWSDVDDLTRLSGIGPARLSEIEASELLCEP